MQMEPWFLKIPLHLKLWSVIVKRLRFDETVCKLFDSSSPSSKNEIKWQ